MYFRGIFYTLAAYSTHMLPTGNKLLRYINRLYPATAVWPSQARSACKYWQERTCFLNQCLKVDASASLRSLSISATWEQARSLSVVLNVIFIFRYAINVGPDLVCVLWRHC